MNPNPNVHQMAEKLMRIVPSYCITTENDLSSANFHGASIGDRVFENAVAENNMSVLMRIL